MIELRRFAIRIWPQGGCQAVVAGAVWACATTWLVCLLLATFWAVNQGYHPFVFVYSLILLPTLTAIGTLLGAVGGLVLSCFRQRRRFTYEFYPGYVRHLVQRGMVMIVSGTALIVIGSIVPAEIEYRKVAKLVWLGGSIDPVGREVYFPDGVLTDADLPVIVECLNQSDWNVLNLAGTNVTGDGLRHLRGISNAAFYLQLSTEQLDENGLSHVRRLKNLTNLDEIKAAAAGGETLREIPRPDGE